MARQALRAVATKPGEARDDVIARPYGRYLCADGLDDTGTLMAEHHRPVERETPEPVDDMQVAVAHAGGDSTHQHLAAPWLVDIDRFDRQWLVYLAKYGSFDLHRLFPPKTRRIILVLSPFATTTDAFN